MSTSGSDRIEKRVVLRASRTRVWRALTNADEFGKWFGVKLQAPFTQGATVKGQITHPGYEHLTMECVSSGSNPSGTSHSGGIHMLSTRTRTIPRSR